MKTYEYRLRPNAKQDALLWNVLKLSRELYNTALQELNEHYKATGKHLNLFAQDKKHGKTQHPEIPAVVVDTTLKRLHTAFANFFRGIKSGRKIGFPRFKDARRWTSIQFRDAGSTGIDGNRFKAGKLCGGKIGFVKHREMEGTLKSCRIVRRPSGWYLQCICDNLPSKKLAKSDKAIGLDMGVKSLVADSDGNITENPKFLNKSLKKLRIAQRTISRRKKGSRRRKKACRIAARIHERISNQRRDFLHKLSRKYVNEYGLIVVEDLNISGMVRNHCLARSIQDASWNMLDGMIAYKAEEAGRQFVKVNPAYTSQKCSKCGEMVMKSLSVRTHTCPHCGYTDDRDVNAAKNILRLGQSLQELSYATA
jgi:putative transposase